MTRIERALAILCCLLVLSCGADHPLGNSPDLMSRIEIRDHDGRTAELEEESKRRAFYQELEGLETKAVGKVDTEFEVSVHYVDGRETRHRLGRDCFGPDGEESDSIRSGTPTKGPMRDSRARWLSSGSARTPRGPLLQ